MAIAVATVGDRPANAGTAESRRRFVGVVTFDASYPTGGYPLAAAQLGGLAQIDVAIVGGVTSAGKLVNYDAVNKKLKVFSAVGTEVANAASLAGETIVVEAFGI